jgi:sterol desaturase/sphingolipid hydroxylase (fatty acid hydroxylase superfamily)
MLSVIWDTRQNFFWLMVISLACWIFERLFPWRREQATLRRQFGQDLFWLLFNGHYAGILVAFLGSWLLQQAAAAIPAVAIPPPEQIRLLGSRSLWLQFVLFLALKDLLEWGVHNLLHRISWLWSFHKLHHSIEELDWIGNMRFHWMEIAVYKSLTYLPLVVLGVDGRVILWVAIANTLIGHLNHSNLNISWGPLRYLLNSPRMHVWHHELIPRGHRGVNFAVCFSLWDWIFGTAHMPSGQPDRLGFHDMDAYPRGLLGRLSYPLAKLWTRSIPD